MLLGGLVGLAAGLVIAPVAWSFVTALSFGAGLQLVGRRVGTFKIAVRSCAYAQVVTLACIALPFAPALAKAVVPAPELDSAVHAAWVLATFLWPLGTARVAYAAGRGLGLVSGKALAAAAFPMLTCVPAAVYMSEQQLELLGL